MYSYVLQWLHWLIPTLIQKDLKTNNEYFDQLDPDGYL